MECLPLLNEHDLQALGVASAGDRARMAACIAMHAHSKCLSGVQQPRLGHAGAFPPFSSLQVRAVRMELSSINM